MMGWELDKVNYGIDPSELCETCCKRCMKWKYRCKVCGDKLCKECSDKCGTCTIGKWCWSCGYRAERFPCKATNCRAQLCKNCKDSCKDCIRRKKEIEKIIKGSI